MINFILAFIMLLTGQAATGEQPQRAAQQQSHFVDIKPHKKRYKVREYIDLDNEKPAASNRKRHTKYDQYVDFDDWSESE